MRERWKAPAEDAEFLDRLIDESVNLLGSIYGQNLLPDLLKRSEGHRPVARI